MTAPKPRCNTSRDGNPFYPLPSDYEVLSPPNQQAARRWACARRDSPDEFVESWSLFRELYFRPTDTHFYRGIFYESPQCHYEWIRDFIAYPRNLEAAPRGTSKSTVLGKELPMMIALTMPYTVTSLVMATDNLIEDRFGEIQKQFQENEYLLTDYGQQRPPKGSGTWNLHRLNLISGSLIQGVSVESRKRGMRPWALILDDPEFDPTHEFEETNLLKELETLLFRQLLPMLDPGSRMVWIGTMISRRAALWAACMGTDPRFRMWNRRVYGLTDRDLTTGRTEYLWKSKWGPKQVAIRRRELGEAAYQAECENNPVSASDRILHIEEPYDTYTVSGGKISWYIRGPNGVPELCEAVYEEWLDKLARVFTVDPALSLKLTADQSSILCVGIDTDRIWWVLDLFLGRMTEGRLIDEVYRMGLEWQPTLVGVESIAFQDLIRGRMESDLDDLTAGTSWQPRVWPITYPPRISKPARFERLGPRMSRHGIRFPLHLEHVYPMKQLFTQVRDFTPDLALLPHDDAIEGLSMISYCPRVHPAGIDHSAFDDSPAAQLLQGRTTDFHTGLPLGLFIDPQTLDPRIVSELYAKRYTRQTRANDHRRESTAQEILAKLGSSLTAQSLIMNRRRRP